MYTRESDYLDLHLVIRYHEQQETRHKHPARFGFQAIGLDIHWFATLYWLLMSQARCIQV